MMNLMASGDKEETSLSGDGGVVPQIISIST